MTCTPTAAVHPRMARNHSSQVSSMAGPASTLSFVDHYEVLGVEHTATLGEIKKAYFDKLREFHPDKRPGTTEGHGQRVTQALNEAWENLKDPAKREVYDYVWQKEKDQAKAAELLTPQQKADTFRRRGNNLYNEGQSVVKAPGPESLFKATVSLQKYQQAIAEYSQGLELAPNDHRLYSNRALCYSALKDWAKCREDAARVTELKPDYMKGHFLLSKALLQEGSPAAAQRQLETGLRFCPGSPELMGLLSDLREKDSSRQGAPGTVELPTLTPTRGLRGGGGSRSVSPACTPTASTPTSRSRVATPPPIGRSATRDASPTRGKQRSKSPVRPGTMYAPQDVTAQFGDATAQFGAETADFGGAPPPPDKTFLNKPKRPWADPTGAPPPPPNSTPPRGRGFFDRVLGRSSSRSPGPTLA